MGQPNYFLLAMAAAFLVALLPGAAYRAVDGLTATPASWLPTESAEAQDLAWLDRHFDSQRAVTVSWEGCTLAKGGKLSLLGNLLVPAGGGRGPESTEPRWFVRAISGPDLLAQLTAPPLALSRQEAIRRLEGTFIGPASRGASTGAEHDQSRATCLMVELSSTAMASGPSRRAALDQIAEIAETQCGVARRSLRLGGPVVEQSAVGAEAATSLSRWGALAGVFGLGLSVLCLRNVVLGATAFGVAAAAGAASLALACYYGVYEVMSLELPAPRRGVLDPLTACLPAIALVIACLAAFRFIGAFREARRHYGRSGATEVAFRRAVGPLAASVAITALAGAALTIGDFELLPQFGLYAAGSAIVAVALVLLVIPAVLHRFPLEDEPTQFGSAASPRGHEAWITRFLGPAIKEPLLVAGGALAIIAVAGLGMLRLAPSAGWSDLVGPRTRAAAQQDWLAANVADQTPLDVVLVVPHERTRAPGEEAEADGQQYRLAPLEQMNVVRQIHARLAKADGIGGVFSPATFAPDSGASARDGETALAAERECLLDARTWNEEQDADSELATGRDLWRLSARIHPIGADSSSGGYDKLLESMKSAVAPVLLACQERDWLVRALHQRGKELAGAKICILFRAPNSAVTPPEETQEAILANLLSSSGVAAQGVSYYNLTLYEKPLKNSAADDQAYRKSALAALAEQDAVVLASAGSDPAASALFAAGVPLVDVTELPAVDESADAAFVDDGSPRPIRARYAGLPIVEHRASELLQAGTWWGLRLGVAVLCGALILVARDFVGGALATVAAIAPLLLILGAMGWSGIEANLGIVALGLVAVVAGVDATVHYLADFRRSRFLGVGIEQAARDAARRTAPPTVYAALVCGVAAGIFALGGFAPLHQFGAFALATLAAAAMSSLVILPALVTGPTASFFDPVEEEETDAATVPELAEPTPARQAPIAAPHFPAATPVANGVAVGGERIDSGVEATPRGPHHPATTAPTAQEAADGPHGDLHAKLKNLRRGASARE